MLGMLRIKAGTQAVFATRFPYKKWRGDWTNIPDVNATAEQISETPATREKRVKPAKDEGNSAALADMGGEAPGAPRQVAPPAGGPDDE